MGVAIFIFTDFVHLLKIMFLCDLIFMFQRKNKKSIIIFSIGAMLILSRLLYMCNHERTVFFLYAIALCLFICVIHNEKKNKLIFCGLWIVFLMSMLDLLSTELIRVVFDLLNLGNKNIEELLAATVSLFFIFIVGKIYKSKYKVGVKNIGFARLFFFTILATADAFVVMIMTAISIEKDLGNHKLKYLIFFFIVIIGIFIQLASVILLIISRDTYKEKEEITQKYLDEQIKHYKYLEQREKDTKKFRHDIKSHMQVLSVMTKNGMYSNFDSYMEEINMQIDCLGNVITVNNGIVDAIINKYYSEALQKGIDINIKGMLSNECSITPYDLCTIFSNLLSNAVEAAEKAVEKRISMECRYTDDSIIIITKNTFKDEGQFRHSKIITTKNDIEYHGFGIDNIKDAVERNNGMLDIDIKDSVFTIILKLSN